MSKYELQKGAVNRQAHLTGDETARTSSDIHISEAPRLVEFLLLIGATFA